MVREISWYNKQHYNYEKMQGKPFRNFEEIRKDILALEKETEGRIIRISATSCGRNSMETSFCSAVIKTAIIGCRN